MNAQNIPVTFWLIIKSLTILGFIIYSVFAAVMVRQEHLMADVLEEHFEPILRILTYIHLAAALFMILLALFLL